MGLLLFGKLCAVQHHSDTEPGRDRVDKVKEKIKVGRKWNCWRHSGNYTAAESNKMNDDWEEAMAARGTFLGFLNKSFDC